MRSELVIALKLEHERLRSLLDRVPADRLVAQPPGVPNHALWTVGHLAHSMEAIGGELGLAAWLPEHWAEIHGRGSAPVDDASAYAGIDVLREALAAGIERITQRLEQMEEAELRAPLPDARFRSTYPTLGHAALHVIASHFAFHVGQLSCWVEAVQQQR